MILLIIYFVFIKPKPEVAPVQTDNGQVIESPSDAQITTVNPGDKPRDYKKYNIDNEPTHETTADDLGKISMSFAERFGSFSNQSKYGNFTDLKILMTDEMKTWSDSYVEKLKKQPQNSNVYYGVTTKALTYEVVSFNEMAGTAEILVGTQRRESTEKINGGEAYNQNLTLTLVNSDAIGNWLFDSASWSK